MEIYVGKHICGEQAESLYDAMYAEFFGDRKKTRRKPDNRTHEQRIADWSAEKEHRRWHHFDRDWELYNRDWKARSDYMSHAERKIRKAEQIAREDWEIESAEIELDAEFNFWAQKIENERLASLNEWLKYA